MATNYSKLDMAPDKTVVTIKKITPGVKPWAKQFYSRVLIVCQTTTYSTSCAVIASMYHI